MGKQNQPGGDGKLKPAASTSPAAGTNPSGTSWRPWQTWVTCASIAAVALSISYRLWIRSGADGGGLGDDQELKPRESDATNKPRTPPGKKPTEDTFLSEFEKKDDDQGIPPGKEILSNEDLEKHFNSLLELRGRLDQIHLATRNNATKPDTAQLAKINAERERLSEEFDRTAVLLEKSLGQAKLGRPADLVPRWLAGEVLMLVGGAPEEVYPHLQFAAARGLKTPRLLGSLARTQFESHQFDEAERTASQGLDASGKDRYLWHAYMRAAASTNRLDQLIQRLDSAFPTGLTSWAKDLRREAVDLRTQWQAEEKIRQAEAVADDLPRVRMVIEHRRFAKDASGQQLATIESTGRAEVIVELFENEAPNTVANFLDLVGRKFYDGTSFHLAIATVMAVGGDPNTKNADPADDGMGGPGHVIPDEFNTPRARRLFRGSLAMLSTGPRSTGSQFFFTLSPRPDMHGEVTVFGRVLKGQEAIDTITRGRTTRNVGVFGRIIPGDLLISAEILRKRAHEYPVKREKK